MKKNPLMQAKELADLLNDIKAILTSVQSQLVAQDLRITKIEEMFAAGEQDLADEQAGRTK